jgi:hypothetical protein
MSLPPSIKEATILRLKEQIAKGVYCKRIVFSLNAEQRMAWVCIPGECGTCDSQSHAIVAQGYIACALGEMALAAGADLTRDSVIAKLTELELVGYIDTKQQNRVADTFDNIGTQAAIDWIANNL